MKLADLSEALSRLDLAPREFVTGWIEGRARYWRATDKAIIGASQCARGSLGYAASQAAVAFHIALDDHDAARDIVDG